ncbi:MAG: hypothetical protein HXY34_09105 [Candidatus Thorarchaeota archaeon]|nr:hypothetical protein [Candidatus Thorarchaeota archaeon]
MASSRLDPTKVRYVSLVRIEGGEPILSIPYHEMSVDPDLLASFALAIVVYEGKHIKTFVKEGYVVMIEEGEHVVGFLIVDRVDDEDLYRNSLREIVNEFERMHIASLQNWRGDIRPFRQFALQVLSVFPYRILEPSLVPRLTAGNATGSNERTVIPWSVGETDRKLHTIVSFINGKRTLAEIATASGLPMAETMAVFSMLDRFGWIQLTRRISDDSVLTRLNDPPEILKATYGDQLLTLMDAIDGVRTFKEVCEAVHLSPEAVRTVAQRLLDARILGFKDNSEAVGK